MPLLYIFLLFIVINLYLRYRKGTNLSITQKFMVSLMSIALVFLATGSVAYFFADGMAKINDPAFFNLFLVLMLLVLPIIMTELVLAGYLYYMKKRGGG